MSQAFARKAPPMHKRVVPLRRRRRLSWAEIAALIYFIGAFTNLWQTLIAWTINTIAGYPVIPMEGPW